MVIETEARKPLLIAINIENTLFSTEIKVSIQIYILNFIIRRFKTKI